MRVHEVPTAILLRKTALKASVGNDPIDRRPGSGGHLGRAIPHGTGITLAHRTDTRVGLKRVTRVFDALWARARLCCAPPCPRGPRRNAWARLARLAARHAFAHPTGY